MKKFFFIFLLSVLCTFARAQDSITARKHIEILSSKDFHGRGIAYNGELKAAEYLREQLRHFGVEPLGDDFFQEYEHPGFSMEGEVFMEVNHQKLTPGNDFRIAPFSKSTDKSVNIITVKAKELTSDKKIAAINKKYASSMPSSMVYFDASHVKIKKSSDNAYFQNSFSSDKNPFKSSGIIKGVENMPSFGLSHTDKERDFAMIYVKASRMPEKATKATIRFNNRLIDYTHHNVCGIIHGSKYPKRYIVLTAHYDHLGAMGDEVYYPGAHDNASGCAMLLNFAQYFSEKNPEYSIVFLFFAGEESGLLGSKFFIDNPLINLEDIKYLINFDLLAAGDNGITIVNSTEGEGLNLYKQLVQINDEEKLLPKIVQRANTANSDHYFFTEKKVPALFLYTMGGRTGAYHDPSDSSENCTLTMFDNIFRLFIRLFEKSE